MHNVTTLPPSDDNPMLKGALRYAVLVDGTSVASGELLAHSWLGAGTGRFVNFRWTEGHLDAAAAVLDAIVAAAGPGAYLNVGCDVEVHKEHVPQRRALLESRGFTVWQEKEGFLWTDNGQELPEPEGVVVRTIDEVGPDRFVEVIAACTAGHLDRVEAGAIATLGATVWAESVVEDDLADGEHDCWYVIENPAGEAVGFLAFGEFDEESTGTVWNIGVVTEHRGHGYVNQLLRLANRSARRHGLKYILSDTDTMNPPIMAAMERNGHHAADRPWHKWYYHLTVS